MSGGVSAICQPFCFCHQVDAVGVEEPAVPECLDALAWAVLDLMMTRTQGHDAIMSARQPAAVNAGRDVMDRCSPTTDEAAHAGYPFHVPLIGC